jgi:hypothetical protein
VIMFLGMCWERSCSMQGGVPLARVAHDVKNGMEIAILLGEFILTFILAWS